MIFLRRSNSALLVLGAWLAVATTSAAIGTGRTGVVTLAVATCASVLLFIVSEKFLFALLAFAVVVQVPLGSYGPLADVGFAEILVPFMLGLLAIRLLIEDGPHRALRWMGDSRVGSIVLLRAALLTFGAVILANLFRSAFSPDTAQGAGVFRSYYGYGIGFGIFLLFFWVLVSERIQFDWLFRILFAISVTLSAIGVGAVALGLPLNLGDLRYSVYDYASGGVRVGFLETTATIGLALLVARGVRFRLPEAVLFGLAMFLSGGRAASVGILIGVLAYSAFARRESLLLMVVSLVVLAAAVLPSVQGNAQVQRLTGITSEQFELDGRTFIYEESFKAFEGQPILGTGLGVGRPVYNPDRALARFYEGQLKVGGHGTYPSLLKNFGLVGILPFLVMLGAVLVGLVSHLRSNPAAGVFFILVCSQVVSAFAGGNGSDALLYFSLAGAAAVIVRADAEVRKKQKADEVGASALKHLPGE